MRRALAARLDLCVANPTLARAIAPWIAAGLCDAADAAVVDVLAERAGARCADAEVALALALAAVRFGHVGLALRAQVPWDEPDGPAAAGPRLAPARLRDELARSPLVTIEGPDPGDGAAPERPFRLVLRDHLGRPPLLSCRRLHHEEVRTAEALGRLAAATPHPPVDATRVDALVTRLLPGDASAEARAAVRTCLRRALGIVTGGPGTGKTYTVQRLLAVLLAAAPADAPLRVVAAAPTGKAAARLTEALGERLAALDVPEAVRERLQAIRATTVHGLLRIRPDGTCRHGPGAPLPADVVVVDEASMLDLTTMRRLVEAVAHDPAENAAARLVLLGDPDQLASVEAGAVLADLVDPAAGLGGHVARLTVGHRFGEAPRIAALAAAIREDRVSDALALLGGGGPPDPCPDRIRHVLGPRATPTGVLRHLAAPLSAPGGLADVLRADRWRARAERRRPADPAAVERALDALARYRVLTTYRRGPLGAETLAEALEAHLIAAADLTGFDGPGGIRAGSVVLVTRNDPRVGLRNGDVGLVLPDGDRLSAFFRDAGAIRRVHVANLPAWERGAAMTVHKSQGSQFERVAFVVGDREGPLLTRELVYTAVTRARARIDWYGDPAVVERALGRRIERATHLAHRLAAARRAGGGHGPKAANN